MKNVHLKDNQGKYLDHSDYIAYLFVGSTILLKPVIRR